MRILLVGEYSRLHNSLKEGLQHLGHDVIIIGTGDYFKNFPVDIKIKRNYESGFSKKIKVGLFRLFKFDITSLKTKYDFLKHKDSLINYDVVQLINESSWAIQPKHELELFNFLYNNNKSIFLLSCGADYISVNYAYQKKLRYSIMTPFFEGRIQVKAFQSVLKFLEPNYKNLHQYLYKHVKGVIASDLDYHIPLLGHDKYLGLIPNPINIDILDYSPTNITGKIVIFHGINTMNYYKKGNDIFEAALLNIKKKFSDKTEIITLKSVPYAEYIKAYNSAHIVLDQIFAYDQGYNALEAMAKGKVVFTGAEKEWLEFYKLKENTVVINALPDVQDIVEKLEWLILNPEKILEISRNARDFIEREHNYIKVAEKYLKVWSFSS